MLHDQAQLAGWEEKDSWLSRATPGLYVIQEFPWLSLAGILFQLISCHPLWDVYQTSFHASSEYLSLHLCLSEVGRILAGCNCFHIIVLRYHHSSHEEQWVLDAVHVIVQEYLQTRRHSLIRSSPCIPWDMHFSWCSRCTTNQHSSPMKLWCYASITVRLLCWQ